jgi:RNA recognition motif-containing protein
LLKRTFAFVEFENSKDAAHAIETMHGVTLDGSKLDVEVPRKKCFAYRDLGPRGERG